MILRKEMSVFNRVQCGVVGEGIRLRTGGSSPGREKKIQRRKTT